MFGRRNPRSLPPFQKGELSSSKLNSLRIAASKRIRGLFGRDSASSASTSVTKQQSLRERPVFGLNKTGQNIPAFSIFTIKKSGEIDYAWGPPVRTEANSFEHGFIYYTNKEFEIADGEGHWCETVGDLPVLIRNAEQETPKIGHPIGPKEDGTLTIERCGYVVVAEPWIPGDMGLEGNYVWVTKSNDQVIRVRLTGDIARRARGTVCVLGVPPLDPDEEEVCGSVDDPNTIAPDPGFEIRKVINLTHSDLEAGEVVQIHPVLGIGYAIIDMRATAIVGGKLTSDRTRKRHPDNSRFGDADARIDWIAGAGVPNIVGDTIKVVFNDTFKLEAVAECWFVAEYFSSYIPYPGADRVNEGIYLVKRCQGLPARINFVTLEDRNPFAYDQDVLAVPIAAYGFADDDLPIPLWYQVNQGQGGFDCGTITLEWNVSSQIWLKTGFDQPSCCIETWTQPPPPSDPQQSGQQVTIPYGVPGPNCDPPTVQPEFYVRFPQLEYPRAIEGSDGSAELWTAIDSDDPADMRYVVLVANQLAHTITSSLATNMCGTAASVQDIEIASVWPFSQKKPNVLSIPNPKSHYGIAGDKISAFWNESIQDYEVFDVDGHVVGVTELSSVTVDGCTSIGGITRQVRVELCEPNGEPVSVISYRQQTVTDVTGVRFSCADESAQTPTKITVDITQYEGFVACGNPNPTEFSAELPMVDVVDSVELSLTVDPSGSQDSSGCANPLLALLYSTRKAIGCGDSSALREASRIVPEIATVLASFDADGCPMWVSRSILILPGCSDSTLHEATCEPCPTDSSGS